MDTPELAKERRKLFHKFDPDLNGYLTFSECFNGTKKVLSNYLDGVFDTKPALFMAFHYAKSNGSDKSKYGALGISLGEFKIFLYGLR